MLAYLLLNSLAAVSQLTCNDVSTFYRDSECCGSAFPDAPINGCKATCAGDTSQSTQSWPTPFGDVDLSAHQPNTKSAHITEIFETVREPLVNTDGPYTQGAWGGKDVVARLQKYGGVSDKAHVYVAVSRRGLLAINKKNDLRILASTLGFDNRSELEAAQPTWFRPTFNGKGPERLSSIGSGGGIDQFLWMALSGSSNRFNWFAPRGSGTTYENQFGDFLGEEITQTDGVFGHMSDSIILKISRCTGKVVKSAAFEEVTGVDHNYEDPLPINVVHNANTPNEVNRDARLSPDGRLLDSSSALFHSQDVGDNDVRHLVATDTALYALSAAREHASIVKIDKETLKPIYKTEMPGFRDVAPDGEVLCSQKTMTVVEQDGETYVAVGCSWGDLYLGFLPGYAGFTGQSTTSAQAKSSTDDTPKLGLEGLGGLSADGRLFVGKEDAQGTSLTWEWGQSSQATPLVGGDLLPLGAFACLDDACSTQATSTAVRINAYEGMTFQSEAAAKAGSVYMTELSGTVSVDGKLCHHVVFDWDVVQPTNRDPYVQDGVAYPDSKAFYMEGPLSKGFVCVSDGDSFSVATSYGIRAAVDNTTVVATVPGSVILDQSFYGILHRTGTPTHVLHPREAAGLNHLGGGAWFALSYDAEKKAICTGLGNADKYGPLGTYAAWKDVVFDQDVVDAIPTVFDGTTRKLLSHPFDGLHGLQVAAVNAINGATSDAARLNAMKMQEKAHMTLMKSTRRWSPRGQRALQNSGACFELATGKMQWFSRIRAYDGPFGRASGYSPQPDTRLSIDSDWQEDNAGAGEVLPMGSGKYVLNGKRTIGFVDVSSSATLMQAFVEPNAPNLTSASRNGIAKGVLQLMNKAGGSGLYSNGLTWVADAGKAGFGLYAESSYLETFRGVIAKMTEGTNTYIKEKGIMYVGMMATSPKVTKYPRKKNPTLAGDWITHSTDSTVNLMLGIDSTAELVDVVEDPVSTDVGRYADSALMGYNTPGLMRSYGDVIIRSVISSANFTTALHMYNVTTKTWLPDTATVHAIGSQYPIGLYDDTLQMHTVFGDTASFKMGGPSGSSGRLFGKGHVGGIYTAAGQSGNKGKASATGGDAFVRTLVAQ